MVIHILSFLAFLGVVLLGSVQSPPSDIGIQEVKHDAVPLLARQTLITGVVERIDHAAARVTLRTNQGRTVSVPIDHLVLLHQVKEGDRVDIRVLSDQDNRPVQILSMPHGLQTLAL